MSIALMRATSLLSLKQLAEAETRKTTQMQNNKAPALSDPSRQTGKV